MIEHNNNINNNEEFPNNDDNNNIDNLNSNNNINNVNNNRINLDASNNNNNNNNNRNKKYKKITISFLIIFLINLSIKIYSYFYIINYRKYVFQFAPIYEKNQYYRFISNYFVHWGIWHIIVELYLSWEICFLFENIMGTLITISFIMVSMLINSMLHFIMVPLIMFISNILHSSYDLNYDYETSLTSILFSMTTFYFLFKENKDKKINILFTFILNVNYLTVIMLGTLYIFTPNKSFYSNLSGIINGYLLKFFPHFFLPKVTWVIDFEEWSGLKNFEGFYRRITYKNRRMRNCLNELQKNSVIDGSLLKNNNYGNDFNSIGRQMSELSNIQSNNNIN